MALIGAVIVGLLIVIAGLLVLLHHQGEHRHAQAERRHDEQRAQAFEGVIAIVETLHLVGHAMAAEVREAERQRRNDLRLANRLPRVSEPTTRMWRMPPTTFRSASSRRADEETHAPHDEPPLPSPVPAPPLPAFELNEDDERTPTSGWTPEQVRQHLVDASGAEERAQ